MAFEWIDKAEGIFRRDPTPDNPTGIFRRIECTRCGGYGEDEMGVCYRCGSTGSIDIPQIEGIGGRTIDSFDPYEEESDHMRYVSKPEINPEYEYYDFDRWESGEPDSKQPEPPPPPPEPINNDDIPF